MRKSYLESKDLCKKEEESKKKKFERRREKQRKVAENEYKKLFERYLS